MSFNVLTAKKNTKGVFKNVLNVKNTVIKNCNLYSDKNDVGVKTINNFAPISIAP